jgi:hypothetical protein
LWCHNYFCACIINWLVGLSRCFKFFFSRGTWMWMWNWNVSSSNELFDINKDNLPLLILWQKQFVEFESNETLNLSLVCAIHCFARGGKFLFHQGQTLTRTWQSFSHYVTCVYHQCPQHFHHNLHLVSSL